MLEGPPASYIHSQNERSIGSIVGRVAGEAVKTPPVVNVPGEAFRNSPGHRPRATHTIRMLKYYTDGWMD